MRLTSLSIPDKVKLINSLKNYKIEYRDILNLSSKTTIGIEIEFINANKTSNKENLAEYNQMFNKKFESNEYNVEKNGDQYDNAGWKIKKEIDCSGEFASPILRNTKEDMLNIKKVYEMMNDNNFTVNDSCSLHVNIGGDIFRGKLKNVISFLKLYSIFEYELIGMSKGDFNTMRKGLYHYAAPFSYRLFQILKDGNYKFDNTQPRTNAFFKFLEEIPTEKIIEEKVSNRFNSLSFINVRFARDKQLKFTNKQKREYKDDNFKIVKLDNGRFEFRFPNPTLDPIIVQNTINILAKFTEAAVRNPKGVDKLFNKYEPFMDKRIKMMKEANSRRQEEDFEFKLGKEELTKIMDLADFIFDKELDKKNMLKQAIDNMDIDSVIMEMEK